MTLRFVFANWREWQRIVSFLEERFLVFQTALVVSSNFKENIRDNLSIPFTQLALNLYEVFWRQQPRFVQNDSSLRFSSAGVCVCWIWTVQTELVSGVLASVRCLHLHGGECSRMIKGSNKLWAAFEVQVHPGWRFKSPHRVSGVLNERVRERERVWISHLHTKVQRGGSRVELQKVQPQPPPDAALEPRISAPIWLPGVIRIILSNSRDDEWGWVPALKTEIKTLYELDSKNSTKNTEFLETWSIMSWTVNNIWSWASNSFAIKQNVQEFLDISILSHTLFWGHYFKPFSTKLKSMMQQWIENSFLLQTNKQNRPLRTSLGTFTIVVSIMIVPYFSLCTLEKFFMLKKGIDSTLIFFKKKILKSHLNVFTWIVWSDMHSIMS